MANMEVEQQQILPDNQEGDAQVMKETQLKETQSYSDPPHAPTEVAETLQQGQESQPPTPVDSEKPNPGRKAVEAMSWQDLQHVNTVEYCSECGCPVETMPGKVIRKKSHTTVQCKSCHNVTTLLYRNYDMKALGFREMPQAEIQDFFQKAKEAMDSTGKKLDAGKIKTLLTTKMTEVAKNEKETAVNGDYLPLSVYAKRGYDTTNIEAKAEKLESDLFGWVYRVPTLSVNYRHVEQEVKETIKEATRRVKPQKRYLNAKYHCHFFTVMTVCTVMTVHGDDRIYYSIQLVYRTSYYIHRLTEHM